MKLPPAKPPPFQVIPDLTTFIGREAALQTGQAWLLTEHHSTPYVLEGTAGVGKTVLAARLAYRLRIHFADGVLWARPDTADNLTILHQFAEALGHDVSSYVDLDSRSALVRGMLADKRVLMVLDNVPSSAQIQPLLPPSGSCAVLITSRRRNLLPSIPSTHRLHITQFEEAESLTLFAQILGTDGVAQERAAFVELANLLGHLPLAIDITACRLAFEPGWTATKFLTMLEQEKGLLNSLAHEGQSVRAAFEASFGLLTTEQQRFFATLSTFGGAGFTAEMAAIAANISMVEAEVNLRELFCLSLVRRGRPYPHYRLIPALQTLAAENFSLF